MSVITYCYQKNPLRVHTKPHIRLCYAWSSQRFKSLPSILCEIVVVQSRLPDKSRSFSQNNVSTGDLNRGRRVKPRLLFGSFCRSKKNKLVPFRELPDKQEVCPCRGSMLFGSFCRNKKNVKPFPFGNISPAFKKAGQKYGASGRRPIPVHAKRVQIHHASRA